MKRKALHRGSGVKVTLNEAELFELEIFVAKKCINLSTLYEKIYASLNNPDSLINGYSLYEVEGSWRSRIDVSSKNKQDFKTLKALKGKHGQGAFKDLIRPMVERGGEKFAIFDEASVVLKIIIESTRKINWEDSDNPVMQEIKGIFSDMTKNEKSIFFTLKELKKTGSIQR